MSDPFIYVRQRKLPYETFDADNHMYENRDAFTKFIPKEYEGIIKYVDINGRTKVAIEDTISDYIPNPTFGRVAVPGGYGQDVTKGGDGIHRKAGDPAGRSKKRMAMPGLDAFFDPEPRLALMKDMGIDRTLLWPTLASVVEERLADDPDAACVVVHALNEWMHEHWTYVLLRRHLRHPDHQLWRSSSGPWRSWSSSPTEVPRSSFCGWRRCRRGRAAGPLPSRSSTRSGRGFRSSIWSSGCTQATPVTPATPTSGRARRPRVPGLLPQRVAGVPGLGVGEERPGRCHGIDYRARARHPVPRS